MHQRSQAQTLDGKIQEISRSVVESQERLKGLCKELHLKEQLSSNEVNETIIEEDSEKELSENPQSERK